MAWDRGRVLFAHVIESQWLLLQNQRERLEFRVAVLYKARCKKAAVVGVLCARFRSAVEFELQQRFGKRARERRRPHRGDCQFLVGYYGK